MFIVTEYAALIYPNKFAWSELTNGLGQNWT